LISLSCHYSINEHS